MYPFYKLKFVLILLTGFIFTHAQSVENNKVQNRADIILNQIFALYSTGNEHLFNETFPYKPENKVTYLAGNDNLEGQKVVYLWPTSGVYSGVNALFKTTKNEKYLQLIEEEIIPGLQNYFDEKRAPYCYQSYINQAEKSDRFYDDNVWLAIDFCETFQINGDEKYLQKSIQLWQFILSGWDENLGGGIYWCEQKKQSKNTCSNAPAAVLALHLFEATNDTIFLNWGQQIYGWTKENLQDTIDNLYFDNINLAGKTDQRKYTYNSGQMLQAAALLYKITGEEKYLVDAQKIAASAIPYFTEIFKTPEGKTIQLFKNTGNWFNAVLMRGYVELYQLDKNPEFILIFENNLDYLWNFQRDENGLFDKDWKGEKVNKYKWLLDQASMVEMYAIIDELIQKK